MNPLKFLGILLICLHFQPIFSQEEIQIKEEKKEVDFEAIRVGYSHLALSSEIDKADGFFLGYSKIFYISGNNNLTYYIGSHFIFNGKYFTPIPEISAFGSWSFKQINIDCWICNFINSVGVGLNPEGFQIKGGLNIGDFIDLFFGHHFNFKNIKAMNGVTFTASLQIPVLKEIQRRNQIYKEEKREREQEKNRIKNHLPENDQDGWIFH